MIKDKQQVFFSFSLFCPWRLSSVSLIFLTFLSGFFSLIPSCLLCGKCSCFLYISPLETSGGQFIVLLHSNHKNWHFNQNSYYIPGVLWRGEREFRWKTIISAISLFAKRSHCNLCYGIEFKVILLSSWVLW